MKILKGSFRLYWSAVWIGLIATIIVLVIICNVLGYDTKSAFSIYFAATLGFLFKSVFFFGPLLFLKSVLDSKSKSALLGLIPFILFVLWYVVIIGFNIELLEFDVGAGYFNYFPHFYIQLIVAIIIPMVIVFRNFIKLKKAE